MITSVRFPRSGRPSRRRAAVVAAALALAAIPIGTSGTVPHAAAADTSTLVANPSVETPWWKEPTVPVGWGASVTGGWATTVAYRSFGGHTGNRYLESRRTGTWGETLWMFEPVAVVAGRGYVYSDWYRSDTDTTLVARYTSAGGARASVVLAKVPASSGSTWRSATVTFTPPSGTTRMTIVHVLSGVGYLHLDDVNLWQSASPTSTTTTTTTTTTTPTASTSTTSTTSTSTTSTSTSTTSTSTTTSTTVAPTTSTSTTSTSTSTSTTTTAPVGDPFTPTKTVGPIPDIPTNLDPSPYVAPSNWPWSAGYPAFRIFCEYSHVGYDDPIVYPGQPGRAHLHTFFGNTGTNATSTYESLRTTGGSSCDGGPLNRTGYWAPSVFDASGSVVVPLDLLVYYKAENAPVVNGTPQFRDFPNGLRMIAGARTDGLAVDPAASRPDGGSGLVWGWKCEGSSSTNSIPSCPAGTNLVGVIRFPYCWDGVHLDSADHRSHLRYGVNNTWGPCPSGWVHIPEVTEMVRYGNPTGGTDRWSLSSDMMSPSGASGSTLHADWYGAWDNGIQRTWSDACLRGFRSASNGVLCDGRKLTNAPDYTGPRLLTGWSAMKMP